MAEVESNIATSVASKRPDLVIVKKDVRVLTDYLFDC
jgi:hypothetical protein